MTLAILADDLTGACDAAAPFARRGVATVVVLDPAYLDPAHLGLAERPAVLAVDADTRRLSRRLAGARTGLAARALRAGGATRLYKKIDSTLRGHVAVELAATLRAWDAPLAIVCPAFPSVGRWVQDGHLFVDKRGDLGGVDELAGLAGSGNPGARPPTLGRRLARLGLDVVGGGADAVAAALERVRREGARVVVADANTPGHLTALAVAATRLEPAALLVGSAGLANALAEAQFAPGAAPRAGSTDAGAAADRTARPGTASGRGVAGATAGAGSTASGRGAPAASIPVDPAPAAPRPWLVVCGSQTEVTQHQVVELARSGARVIELDVDELLAGTRLAESAGEEAARMLWAGTTPVLRLVVRPDAGGVPSRGSRLDDRAARALARACREAVGGARPAGLFLTGGLTARACLLALGAHGLRLEQEPLPGIAAGRALGGAWDGRAVVTKAGGFGAPDAIKRLVGPGRA